MRVGVPPATKFCDRGEPCRIARPPARPPARPSAQKHSHHGVGAQYPGVLVLPRVRLAQRGDAFAHILCAGRQAGRGHRI